ncbi:uncharacterized protein si:ch73-100l22.3 isoform X2 [Plectropomus leopardus]|uniref:uncharacterized protein si:ch73-100l22.3 isoform X2 n=1 Tax=Plectropomus leopardus TaxID=160734 RepID=UPI001C4A9BC4|nr:uncharacterized protein si:ch73-100l22.3 isoform X2 [Plectropomus leopardus]
MEDYDKFVQHRLSHLRQSERQHNKTPPASSLILFYGRPVLPPLLSAEQRKEMRQHRDAAQEAAVCRKLKHDSRVAFVQTILDSVQLRKMPTLEELLQESEMNTKSSYSHDTSGGSVSKSNFLIGTKDSLSLPPSPERTEKDGVSFTPFTSTTYSAFSAPDAIPQQSYQEGCLNGQLYKQQGSQSPNGASHQSLSSGYITYENVENTTSVSGRVDAEIESLNFGSSYNMSGFFLHNTSNTIAKMPDIISHPPIDGDELERSGLETSFCSNFIEVKDICCTSLQNDSVTCDHLEKSESTHRDSTEGGDNLSFSTVLDLDEEHSLDRIEGSASSLQNSGCSDNPELSQTSSTHHSPTTELHIQHDPTDPEPADSSEDQAKPSEEPYRLSLQALLKKSQEYRRRQRMIRNQAKNTKIPERARVEEQSLSDKENDEFPHKGTVTTEGRKTKERKGIFIPPVKTSKKSWENERRVESEIFEEKANSKSESKNSTGDENTQEITCVKEETIVKNNKRNISQAVITEHEQISTFPQQQSTESLPTQEAFHLTNCPAAFFNKVGKYNTIPAPNFCKSPVRCKSKGTIQEAFDGAETSKRKVLVDTRLMEDHKVDEVNLGHGNSPTAAPSNVSLMVKADVTSVSIKNSQHIDQLESNLSGLKVLISDLESTLTKNSEDRSQTESNTESEFSFRGIKHSHRSDSDYFEDKPRDCDESSDAEQDQRYGEWPRKQSDSFQNEHEDTGPEPSISDADDAPVKVQVKESEAVNVSELRLVKTLATERAKETGTCEGGLTKSHGQHGGCRKPSAKCLLSVTQQLRIPDVFRNVPPATAAARKASVLSDTSNHSAEAKNETEGHNSTQSPSLNQSYDVDSPSGLWLHERSGSDAGSKGHLAQEKHLTPESGGEGQGRVSRVKRRLLMHMSEETRERSADAGRGAGSAVRPTSSTPTAVVRRYEGHGSEKDMQEQLKQAHAAQIRALQDEHRRQQEELLQPSGPLSERYRPLLLAVAKGFLARRLLRTERVAQLVRTIRDTHQFLQALQQQSPGRGELCSRQDLLLQERVALQLRAARYEIHDVFFSLSAGERMQLIGWDRELVRERELRRQGGHAGHPRRKSSLSAATQKSLERKRGVMIQKKAAERHTGVAMRTGHNSGFSAEQPLETKRGQFRANPQRVPKSTNSSRPR